MKLLTKEIEKKIPKLYANDGQGENAIAVVKFFCPWNNWTWFATEGEWQEYEDENGKTYRDFTFFGKVKGHESELGYFNLSELESVRGKWGLKIERDMYFTPKPLKDCE